MVLKLSSLLVAAALTALAGFVVADAYIRAPQPFPRPHPPPVDPQQFPPVQKQLTLEQALKQNLFSGSPEICVGDFDLPHSKSGYGCCLGLEKDSTCFISTPEVTQVMKNWFMDGQGASSDLMAWHGIFEENYRQTLMAPHDKNFLQRTKRDTAGNTSSPIDYNWDDIKRNTINQANAIKSSSEVCDKEINKEYNTWAQEAYAQEIDASMPMPTLHELCPTKRLTTFPLKMESCAALGNKAVTPTVAIPQTYPFLNKIEARGCDNDRIQKSKLRRFMCGIKCVQSYRLVRIVAQRTDAVDLGKICWAEVKVPDGCNAFLDMSNGAWNSTTPAPASSTSSSVAEGN